MTDDMERQPDPVDQASVQTDAWTSDMVTKLRRASAPQQPIPEDGKSFRYLQCVEEDCGEDLPMERLMAGRIRCVDCQTRLEKKQANYRR